MLYNLIKKTVPIGLFLALMFLCTGQDAAAKPEYALKENRPCIFCHVTESPGTVNPRTGKRGVTDRNARGIYYAKNRYSLAGYIEKAPELPKVPAPRFEIVWQTEMKDMPRRVAVADITGDGKPRLISLHENPQAKSKSILKVQRWDGKEFVEDFSTPVDAVPEKMAVGKFGSQVPIVLTANGMWKWNDKGLSLTPAPETLNLFGTAQTKDGEERVLIYFGKGVIKAFRVNMTSLDGKWLFDPRDPPAPPNSVFGDMHSPMETLLEIGVPETIGAGGIMGIWKLKKPDAYFLYHSRIDPDYDLVPNPKDPKNPTVKVKSTTNYLQFRDTQYGIEVWKTPKLSGYVMDVARSDPKGSGKMGFLVLANETEKGKPRTLSFYALVE